MIDHIAREFEILFCQGDGGRRLAGCVWTAEPRTELTPEEGKEQHRRRSWQGVRVEVQRGGESGYAWNPLGNGADRVQIPTTPPFSPLALPPCIRRLSGESGWRQLQWDADRKTPCVVTVAPEILLDETDGRPSSLLFSDERSPYDLSLPTHHPFVLEMSLVQLPAKRWIIIRFC